MELSELIAGTAKLKEMIGLRAEPLAFFYTDQQPDGWRPAEAKWACMVGSLTRARRGGVVYFDREHFGCQGCGVYLGFCQPTERIPLFVSTGVPGQMEGEHYKKSPELVRAYLEANAMPPAPAAYAVFKQVAALQEGERPLVIICFGDGDELAGLVGLAGYARAEDAVVAPFGSGCGTIVSRPLLEGQRQQPRAVLGLFDPSARPCVQANELSFAAPLAMWEEMLGNADESFLTTPTWSKVKKRISGQAVGEA